MIDVKKEAIKVAAGLLYIVILIAIIKLGNLGYLGIYILLALTNGAIMYYMGSSFDVWSKSCGYLAVVLYILYLLSPLGWWGYALSCGLIVFYILYKRWPRFLEVKWHIETMIWGKPLKEFIKEGKRPPKLKLEL